MITLKDSLKFNPNINPDLFMHNPVVVPKKMRLTPIKEWLEFISKDFKLPKKTNLIIVPCSAYKPYDEGKDEFYRRLNSLKLKNSKFITVSVPLGLEPQDYWNFQWKGINLLYDCPFFPWIENFGYKYTKEIENEVNIILKEVIDNFFERNENNIESVLTFLVRSTNPLEYDLVKNHSDIIVPEFDFNTKISYDNNTSEIYCSNVVWNSFMRSLNKNGLIQ